MDVDWIILADAAQATGGKVSILGGGWDTIVVPGDLPHQQRCSISVCFILPQDEADQEHTFELEMTSQALEQPIFRGGGQLRLGQQPGLPPEFMLRAYIVTDLVVVLPYAGLYEVAVRVDGEVRKRLPFRIIAQGVPVVEQGMTGVP